MSDLEKVKSLANQLGKTTTLELRWEGAGDCLHPADLLKSLKNVKYTGSTEKIKFHAQLNLYETQTSTIATRARNNMAAAMAGATTTQTYNMAYGVDVTRGQGSIAQTNAHIMFVRNIMLTNSSQASLTDKADELKDLHVTAIRQRSGSVAENGSLAIGMSGQPGLSSTVRVDDRDATPAKDLFYGSKELFDAATDSNFFILPGHPQQKGAKDADSGEIMKNDGSSLGVKKTYYLTFTK